MKKSSFLLLSLATSLVISNQAPASTPITLMNHTGHTINVNFNHCRQAGSACTFENHAQIQAAASNHQLVLMAPVNFDQLFIHQVNAIDENGKVIASTDSACVPPLKANNVHLTQEGATIVCNYSQLNHA